MERFINRSAAVAFICLFLNACGPVVQPPVVKISDPAPVGTPKPIETESKATLSEPQSEDPIYRIGLMLPLSGPEQAVGQDLFNAASMALFDAYDPRLEILSFDTKGNKSGTRAAAIEALDAGVDIIVGPLLAENVRILSELVEGRNIPVLGLSSDSQAASRGTYIMGFLPEAEIKRVVDYASQHNVVRFSGLIPDSRYGMRIREAYGDAVLESGGQIVSLETYPNNPEAVFEPIKKISNYDKRRKDHLDEIRFLRSLSDDTTDEIANKLAKREVSDGPEIDAVLLPESGALLRTLAPLLPFYEVDLKDVKLLGTGLWYDPSLLKEPPLRGAWFAAPATAGSEAFLTRYKETYNRPASRVSTLAYDAVALIAILCREADLTSGDNPVTLEKLTDPNGYQGIDGLFRFLPDGTNERTLSVLEITKNGFKVLDPAPDAFPQFGFAIRQIATQE